ncbi:hypothetical protein COX24_00115 [bacterium (Candidatus Gribaldobacteria) CG23_combo_of_CG06-09_8_20_14_all_37_87_8]|uniref:Uncharacterized protein n=2 Tax=Candidatus Gribaldobacteria TaxID=2798536 RepID=A0A2G9ZFY8_9BACT|nr:MAG: hypothetical protein AUJ25_01025 [Parcubacteria group bacterium CG1_02_37_13]PIP32085.1 MAG: hypothetical protein COX24_00115 [bacterium (Candidatus Gribaldobacteria) CG23_combo_of_CG06-09_8_20_14_all_37_87_8]PIR90581.1 MAG: hypothetical protein COU05_01395 [bacterium (Candidatus Gribaldobacteria) CG10_big_fil_rev_8_21_14_0_10_37_21]
MAKAKAKVKKGRCSKCGAGEFITTPNQYDVLTFSKGKFEIVGTELINDFKVFCRGCSAEVII